MIAVFGFDTRAEEDPCQGCSHHKISSTNGPTPIIFDDKLVEENKRLKKEIRNLKSKAYLNNNYR